MNEYEAAIQINPTDDIKFILEEPGCYGRSFWSGRFFVF